MIDKPPSIEKLPYDPVKFLERPHWENLSPDEKKKMLNEAARNEIAKTINLVADKKLDLEQGIEVIIRFAKVVTD